MHAIVKIIIGAILLIGAITYVYNDMYGARAALITVVNGTVPAFVGLIGLFIIWLELDELKIERSLKASKKKK